MEPSTAAGHEPSTQELVNAPVGDRCANCHAPLASDQRYCVNCGERRGKARFSFEALTAKPAAAAPPPERPRRRPAISASFGYILGLATLLLAMGVGVLIGHNSNSTPKQASAPSQTIKVEGGLGSASGSAAASTTPTTTTTASKSKAKSHATSAPKAAAVTLKPKVVKKVDQAASKVLGSGSNNLSKNVTQTVGGSCSGGSGCQGGKFTGNYFGGG